MKLKASIATVSQGDSALDNRICVMTTLTPREAE
jgi:hypothetical protein